MRVVFLKKNGVVSKTKLPDNFIDWGMDMTEKKVLSEGLITTYPVRFTTSRLQRMFPGEILGMKYEHLQLYVFVSTGSPAIEDIKTACDRMGWFCSLHVEEDDCEMLAFEQKFQDKVPAKALIPFSPTLYHVTPKYNKEKILKIGFVPSCKNDMFEYTGRTYFFLAPRTIEEMNNVEMMICQLWNKNSNPRKTADYTLMEIDLNKVGDNVFFQQDGNMNNAVFTTDNIAPSCIINIQDIDVESVMKGHGATREDLDDAMNFKNKLKNKD